MNADVPSPIDLRCMPDALEWERTATSKRPWRTEFFECFAKSVAELASSSPRVLELGSGPGFLAEHMMHKLPRISYVLLDFSPAMHELAKTRLGKLAERAEFVERSFKEPGWMKGLGSFDCIVTNQAVHELRHKCHAADLHTAARSLLSPGGIYLVCDHFAGEGGMTNDQLYMSIEEQRLALHAGGFDSIRQLLVKGGLVLHQAS